MQFRRGQGLVERVLVWLWFVFVAGVLGYSTNHQVVIDANTRLVVAVGRPLPGTRNDCVAWEISGAGHRRQDDHHP